MKFLSALIVLLFACSIAQAQDFEYGELSELKGLTKVFIDTGPDVENFNRIKAVINESKVPLTIVSDLNGAELVLAFRHSKETVLIGDVSQRKDAGRGLVTRPSADGKRLRILMNFDALQKSPFQDEPATKFVKAFIKGYKKANGIK